MTRICPNLRSAAKHSTQQSLAPLTWDPADHLLSRFSFGPTAESRAWVAAHGPDAWLKHQIKLGQQLSGYAGNPQIQARSTLCEMGPYDLTTYMIDEGHQYGWDAMDQLSEATLGLQTFSQAQLYETLVDFFSNHLNVPNHNGDQWNLRADYDNTVIRTNAMGSFTDMLIASCNHPAMLTYLSLADSTKNAINYNYGREVLELHTVGLNYSEADVTDTARMLSGRTYDRYWGYEYDAQIHALGTVNVLGFSDPNISAVNGESAGDRLLAYLAAHPYTATHLAYKLCVRYVSDTPSDALVAAVAQAYLDGGTQILPMVTAILCSDEFWSSRGLKERRPAENLIAGVRILGVQPSDWDDALSTLHWMTTTLGQSPLDWPAPNGYPDVATVWRSGGSLLQVWDYHLGFIGGWAGGFANGGIASLYGATTPTTSGQAVDLLTSRISGQPWTAEHRQALFTFLDEPDSTPMSQSAMRWNASYVLGLILHSPYHALR